MPALRGLGYETTMPEGTFYVMARSPIDDDEAFGDILAEEDVLVLPGTVVEVPGWFRDLADRERRDGRAEPGRLRAGAGAGGQRRALTALAATVQANGFGRCERDAQPSDLAQDRRVTLAPQGCTSMLEHLIWGQIPSRRAREILAQVLGLDAGGLPPSFLVEGMVAPLSFYRDWQLFRLSSRYRDGDSETELEDVYALWRSDRQPMLLDGTSAPVHEANADESLALRDEDVADYIRWFCFAVRADEGEPFILFEHPPKRVSAKNRTAAKDARPLTPKGRDADGAARFEATMIFGGTSFRSMFSVPPNGEIVMTDDEPLTDDFPAALIPVYPPLGLGTALRMHLTIGLGAVPTPPPIAAVSTSTRRRSSRKRSHPTSSRSTIVEMVELLAGPGSDVIRRRRTDCSATSTRPCRRPTPSSGSPRCSARSSPVVDRRDDHPVRRGDDRRDRQRPPCRGSAAARCARRRRD